ncbi:putative phospholipid-transporting ATPase IIB [Porphyridium purpureum]|uniref:Phospholipid-transporting ATPase n=1 Tax=Porphyridium purpureum TaxID=35688 RepID=A0A5J4YQE5_PORPP|nr:putative phospholipid-transporting ATPase IIB [Porphyridium purpureum]|eukprot:POR9143..scf236_6
MMVSSGAPGDARHAPAEADAMRRDSALGDRPEYTRGHAGQAAGEFGYGYGYGYTSPSAPELANTENLLHNYYNVFGGRNISGERSTGQSSLHRIVHGGSSTVHEMRSTLALDAATDASYSRGTSPRVYKNQLHSPSSHDSGDESRHWATYKDLMEPMNASSSYRSGSNSPASGMISWRTRMMRLGSNLSLPQLARRGRDATDPKNQEKVIALGGGDLGGRSRKRSGSNAINNRKHNVVTFLPLVLLEQFRMFYNLFFLFIALSQLIPALRIGLLSTYLAPLLFVLCVTLTKEAVDEYKRWVRDREVNNYEYDVLLPSRGNGLGDDRDRERVPSRNLSEGDIIVININERVPADVLLLRAFPSDGSGDGLFIRTDQLDGETDWKLRRAVQYTQKLDSDTALFQAQAEVTAEAPRREIYDFMGKFILPERDGYAEALSLENTLWANTVLASGHAVAMVMYVGRETRTMMNASSPRTKVGLFEHELNFLSKVLFVALALFALTLTALRGWYGDWWLYLFRYMLLLSYIIPISLRVNLDMAKLVYAYMIEHDDKIPGCVVRSTDFPEELGRVGFLLSDKTGTLTQNQMAFKKLHLGAVLFTRDNISDIQRHAELIFGARSPNASSKGTEKVFAQEQEIRAAASTPKVVSAKGNPSRVFNAVQEALVAIGVTHNVTPVEENGSRELQAASPDEVALIQFLETVGIELVSRTATTVQLAAVAQDRTRTLNVLYEFPFTSDAKRMGIVVQDAESGTITFYCKGADSVMDRIVKYNDWLEEECGNLAREGLRTLVFAKRTLSQDEFDVFAQRWEQARLQTFNRKQALADVQRTLERDMQLICITGVEDKLQPNVRSTLEKLRHAGLRIWMLTGDKVETATCVAISSCLVERTQSMYSIVGVTNRLQVSTQLAEFQRMHNSVLIVDGVSLQTLLDHFPSEFVAAASQAPAAVASRCSPVQKAAIVNLLKKHSGLQVAAIGDGGNDVNMIQEANVGIGIPGKEGMQASLAADFSITSFGHLTPLLLWHGRNSYKRSARLALFVMHRGLIIAIIQMVYSAIFFYAAVAVYHSWIMVGYATIFTMFPIFSLVIDEDVSFVIADTYPELYRELQKGRSLNLRQFLIMVFKSVYQGTVIMVFSVYILRDDTYFSLMNLSTVSFSALIFTELLMIAFEINSWKLLMIVAEVFSMVAYLLAILVLSDVFNKSVIFTWNFFGRVLVVTLVSCLPVTLGKFLRRKFSPPAYAKLT